MLKRKTVVWENERMVVTLVVKEASVLTGIKRSRLINEASTSPAWKEDLSIEERIVRQLTYSACVATLESVKIEPREGVVLAPEEVFDEGISVDMFLELPEMLVVIWENGVTELNPHWVPKMPKGKEDDPKLDGSGGPEATKLTSESSDTLKIEDTPSVT